MKIRSCLAWASSLWRWKLYIRSIVLFFSSKTLLILLSTIYVIAFEMCASAELWCLRRARIFRSHSRWWKYLTAKTGTNFAFQRQKKTSFQSIVMIWLVFRILSMSVWKTRKSHHWNRLKLSNCGISVSASEKMTSVSRFRDWSSLKLSAISASVVLWCRCRRPRANILLSRTTQFILQLLTAAFRRSAFLTSCAIALKLKVWWFSRFLTISSLTNFSLV